MTAYSDFKYAQSALRLGVSDYLLKPLKDGELEGAVRKILSVVEVGTIQAGRGSFYGDPFAECKKCQE